MHDQQETMYEPLNDVFWHFVDVLSRFVHLLISVINIIDFLDIHVWYISIPYITIF